MPTGGTATSPAGMLGSMNRELPPANLGGLRFQARLALVITALFVGVAVADGSLVEWLLVAAMGVVDLLWLVKLRRATRGVSRGSAVGDRRR